jgi:hypothetical protein
VIKPLVSNAHSGLVIQQQLTGAFLTHPKSEVLMMTSAKHLKM